jgi:flagellar biosynthesis/type III secretory pathway protein FliH
VQLVKGLYDRGWAAEQVRELFRLIDWMMDLPPEQAEGFREEISQWEAERGMPYLSSIERSGLQQGLEQGLEKGLEKDLSRAWRRGAWRRSSTASPRACKSS